MIRQTQSAQSILQAVRDAVIADPAMQGLLASIPHVALEELPFGPRRNGSNWDLAYTSCEPRIEAALQKAKAHLQEKFDVILRPPGTQSVI